MYTIETLKKILNEHGYDICEYTYPINNCKENIFFKDNDGFIFKGTLDSIKNSKSAYRKVHKSNPYSIANINLIAKQNKINAVCIEEKYIDSKGLLKFRCECGNEFKTTFSNFSTGHKIKCDECSKHHRNYTYTDIKKKLSEHGYELILPECEYQGITLSNLTCVNKDGYKCNVCFSKIMKGQDAYFMHPSNPYSVENIKRFLLINNIPFDLISLDYISNESPMEYKCQRCGNIVKAAWCNINKYMPDGTKGRIYCNNCDGTLESLHAIALKQVFVHEYPDTIPEERSCVNPNTGYVMPTDIVNHRLKIAIEVQSQWHDNRPERDKIKRDYWINRGYDFYAPDIRNYTILEMLQLFFNINKIPEYVNFSYANKLNIKLIQEMLDKLMSPREIANQLNVKIHRIYDAIYSGSLHYHKDYIKRKQTKHYK